VAALAAISARNAAEGDRCLIGRRFQANSTSTSTSDLTSLHPHTHHVFAEAPADLLFQWTGSSEVRCLPRSSLDPAWMQFDPV